MKRQTFLTLLCIQMTAITSLSAQVMTEVATNEVLPVIAVQEDALLKIERFTVLLGPDEKFAMAYSVKNISSKNVVSYRIVRTYDTGTGFLEYGTMPLTKVLCPGQTVGTIGELKISRKKPDYRGELKAIAFMMIVEVTFDDGSTFSDKKLLDAFEERLKKWNKTLE